MTLDYFTGICEACEEIENGEDPPIGKISNRFVLNEYDATEEREKGPVRMKAKRGIGGVPALRMNVVTNEGGRRKYKVRWIVGISPFEELAKKCDEWGAAKGARRNVKGPRIKNMDIRDTPYDSSKKLIWR